MLLPIALNQVKQDVEPLLGCKAEVVGAIRGIGFRVAFKLADDTLHITILSAQRDNRSIVQ
jgi:hypothetical protein